MVVVSGGSVATRSADTLSMVSLARLDATPNAPTTGNSMPATRTPASRHRPRSFSRPSPTRTATRVRGVGSSSRYPTELLTIRNHCEPRHTVGNRLGLESVNVSTTPAERKPCFTRIPHIGTRQNEGTGLVGRDDGR